MRVLELLISFILIMASPLCFAGGKELYLKNCASCHHPEKIGISGPPLLPEFLVKKDSKQLSDIIIKGLPSTLMPPSPHISESEALEIVTFLNMETKVSWGANEIKKSVRLSLKPHKKISYKKITDLTVVVERGQSKVWLMERDQLLDTFDFTDIHGGVKYSRDYQNFFIPTRDGYVGKYDLSRGYYGKVRACINLRNITVSNDNKYVAVSCLLPQQIVILKAKDFSLVKVHPLQGKVSGLYSLIKKNEAVFTYRDRPLIGFYDFKKLDIKYKKVKEPIEDFFIEPLDQFIISSSRGGDMVSVIRLDNQKTVYEYPVSGMPHLSSAAFWYENGEFYFATFHIKSNFITIWKMYDWEYLKKIEVGGNGFFVRTHPKTPHLWIDNGGDEVVLVEKKGLGITKFRPVPGKRFMHTEFSGDGQIAYLSIYEKEGNLILYDTATLKETKRFDANIPVGKYNVVNKEREFLPVGLGESVYLSKCWGCHHQEQVAFGPSFSEVAKKRSETAIRAHLKNPKDMALYFGYKNPTMPKIPLTDAETDMLVSYIQSFKGTEAPTVKLKEISLYNMADHSLGHGQKKVSRCKEYLDWKRLGYAPFKEEDKLEEKKYIELCRP